MATPRLDEVERLHKELQDALVQLTQMVKQIVTRIKVVEAKMRRLETE